MSPNTFMKAACTGSTILRRLHLAALVWIIMIPLCNLCDTPVQSRDICVNSRDTHVKSRDAHAKSRAPPVLTSDTQVSAIAISASSGAPLALPHPIKSRRRRRGRNRRSANENSVPRSAAPLTPDERWANSNSASQRVTQHHTHDIHWYRDKGSLLPLRTTVREKEVQPAIWMILVKEEEE